MRWFVGLVVVGGCASPGVESAQPVLLPALAPVDAPVSSIAPETHATDGHAHAHEVPDHNHGDWELIPMSPIDTADPLSVASGWVVTASIVDDRSPRLIERVAHLSTPELLNELLLVHDPGVDYGVELFVEVLSVEIETVGDDSAAVVVIADHVRFESGVESGVNIVMHRITLVEVDGRWFVADVGLT